MTKRIVFVACSLDGFIAGADDDLSFLQPSGDQEVEDTFTPFLQSVGCIVMGRRTFDVVCGFEGTWPYGDTPVLVLTGRQLESSAPTVQAVSGEVASIMARAQQAAGDGNVYIDGGSLVRQALDAGVVDELVVTLAPRILGQGVPLFAGVNRRHDLNLLSTRSLGAGFVELRYRVAKGAR